MIRSCSFNNVKYDPSDPSSLISCRWYQFVKTLMIVAREALTPEYTASLYEWCGRPPPGGAEALRDFFLAAPHRTAIQTLDYTLFRTPINFTERPFPLYDTMALFSTLGKELFGRVWIELIDVAKASGVPDVDAARKYAREQEMTEFDRLIRSSTLRGLYSPLG